MRGWYDQGRELAAAGRWSEASDVLWNAVRLDGDLDHGEALFLYATSLERHYGGLEDSGRSHRVICWECDARTFYERVLEYNPSHPGARAAIERMNRRLAYREGYGESYDARRELDQGLRLLAAGDLEQAAGRFREAASLDPSSGYAFLNLGYALTELGRLEEALDAYRRASGLLPDHFIGNFNFAWLLSRLQHYDQAVTAARRAIEIDPSSARAHSLYGRALLLDSGPSDAEAPLRRAVGLEPESAEANWLLALTLEMQHARRGDTPTLEESIAHYRVVQKNSEDPASAEGRIRELAAELEKRRMSQGEADRAHRVALDSLASLEERPDARLEFGRTQFEAVPSPTGTMSANERAARQARFTRLSDDDLGNRIDQTRRTLEDMQRDFTAATGTIEAWLVQSQEAEEAALLHCFQLLAGTALKLPTIAETTAPTIRRMRELAEKGLKILEHGPSAVALLDDPSDREANLRAARGYAKELVEILDEHKDAYFDVGASSTGIQRTLAGFTALDFLVDYGYQATRWGIARGQIRSATESLDDPRGMLQAQQVLMRLYEDLIQERRRRNRSP